MMTPAEKSFVAEAIAKSIVHARRVAMREHIKADRIERVNQFIVSLRRELLAYSDRGPFAPHKKQEWVKTFCPKEMWYDIGVMSGTNPELKECLMMAHKKMDATDVQVSQIEAGLELAAAELKGYEQLP